MSAIGGLGIGSGLDLQGLLDQLMQAESIPLTNLQTKEAGVQAQISAFGQLSASISSMHDAAAALTSDKFNALTATSSDKTVATATADADAPPGSFTLAVTKTAVAEKALSSALGNSKTVMDGGTLTFNFGSIASGTFQATPDSEAKQVTIPPGSTLADVSKAINDADIGVTASLLNDGTGTHLMLTGSNTGANNTFQVQGTDTESGNTSLSSFNYDPSTSPDYSAATNPTGMSRLQKAADAEFTIDGLAMTSASNTVTDAISGMTITLLKGGNGSSTTINLTPDDSGAKTALQALVATYNALLNTANTLSANAPSATPGEASAGNGPLAGDTLVNSILSKIRDQIFQPAEGAKGAYTSLSSIGVSFVGGANGDATGQLTFDSDTFDKAMADDPAGIAHLFDTSSNVNDPQGIGASLANALDSIIGTGGDIDSEVKSLKTSSLDMQDQETELSDRLTQIQARYQQQFTNLDTLLTTMDNTSTFLTQQLAALAQMDGN